MWFKQAQIYQLPTSLNLSTKQLTDKLKPFAFRPCLPSLPESAGWIPLNEDDADTYLLSINQYHLFALQIEEKILPATVIRQTLNEAIKQVETSENRKLRQKEKLALKDEIIMTLLPRAFSKLSKVYAYIDTKQHQLVLGTANGKIKEKFVALFEKAIDEDIEPIEISELSKKMTNWLQYQNYPSIIAIEKACMLRHPNQETRIIRAQQQDLMASPIQSLIKDGCEVIQLALSWQDRVNFVLLHDFSIRSIQYQDEIIDQVKELEPETKAQALSADFLIMSDTLSSLIADLLSICHPSKETQTSEKVVAMMG